MCRTSWRLRQPSAGLSSKARVRLLSATLPSCTLVLVLALRRPLPTARTYRCSVPAAATPWAAVEPLLCSSRCRNRFRVDHSGGCSCDQSDRPSAPGCSESMTDSRRDLSGHLFAPPSAALGGFFCSRESNPRWATPSDERPGPIVRGIGSLVECLAGETPSQSLGEALTCSDTTPARRGSRRVHHR